MIRLVTFDVTDTLLRLTRSVGEQYAAAAAKVLNSTGQGVSPSPDLLNRNFRLIFRKLDHVFPAYGRNSGMTQRDWWFRVARETFVASGFSDDKSTRKIFEILYDDYSKGSQWEIIEGARDALDYLKKAKISRGIISNFDDRLEALLQAKNLDSHFDFVVATFNTGLAKPSREIFRMGLGDKEPHEVLHVGDSVEKDYAPARDLGMHAIVVSPDEKNEALRSVPREHVVRNLRDIVLYIDSVNTSI